MPEKLDTTKVLLERQLILFRRERSKVWQCRYKVDGLWQRASTKERDLAKAKVAADKLRIKAEIRKHDNLPVITRKLRDIAKLAIVRMDDEAASGNGKAIYKDYKAVISDYLIPILGKRLITNIDGAALNDLDARRIEQMGKAPSQSTMLTHNAALNRVFDEAVVRNFLTEANRPKLDVKGRVSKRRPAFELEEVRALIVGFDGWIGRSKNAEQKESRLLLRDYVMMLLDTGARPGKELLQLKWSQIKESIKPVVAATDQVDEDGEAITLTNLNRSVEMMVSGKTGSRVIVGMKRTVDALREIGKRNYPKVEQLPVLTPLKNLIKPTNKDFVLRIVREGKEVDISKSLQQMFTSFLKEHNLLIDPVTEQQRVFYSLRHTYATLALTHDKVPIHTLTKQMGTSVPMIEKHYSHLKVVQAIDQLRGEESRQLINAGGVIDEAYQSTKAAKAVPKAKTKKTKQPTEVAPENRTGR